MKVFITGGMGFVGSHIVVELLAKGHEVTVFARDPAKIPSPSGVRFVEGDLLTSDLNLGGYDACIHNALIWEEAPTELEMKDTRVAARVFEAAANARVSQVIYTSSTAVHRPYLPMMDETARLAPPDFYGATKVAGEAFLSAFSYKTEMRCNVVRPGPVVGVAAVAGAPVKGDRRFWTICQAAIAGEAIFVPDVSRQFIGAADLAQVYSSILESDVNRSTYIGLATDSVSWAEVAREAVSLVGSASSVVVEASSEPGFRFDVGKIERDFGLSFRCREAVSVHLRGICCGLALP